MVKGFVECSKAEKAEEESSYSSDDDTDDNWFIDAQCTITSYSGNKLVDVSDSKQSNQWTECSVNHGKGENIDYFEVTGSVEKATDKPRFTSDKEIDF